MKSIRHQLLRSLVPGILLVAVLSGLGLYAFVRHALLKQFDSALTAKAQAVAAAVRWEEDGMKRVVSPDVTAAEFSRAHHPGYFQIIGADGRTMIRSPSLAGADLPATQSSDGPREWDLILPSGDKGRAVALPFLPSMDQDDLQAQAASGAPMPAALTLVLAINREPIDEPLNTLLIALLFGILLLGLGTVIIVGLAVRQSLRPLARLADEAAARDGQPLDHRFPVAGLPLELVPICTRLNELLARLQAAFARERRFTADVAHELRTPIAELRSLAEVGLKWPGDRAAGADALNDALAISRRMEAVVETLLALARCDSGRQPVAHVLTDVNEHIRTATGRYSGAASARDISSVLDLSPELTIETDGLLLGAVLSNLICNAVEYSPAGSKIRCTAGRDEAGVWVEIINPAPELEPADIPHLFEPFWRKDSSRAGDKHCGLGLTLSAAYIRLLGGNIKAERRNPDQFVVKFVLPEVVSTLAEEPATGLKEEHALAVGSPS